MRKFRILALMLVLIMVLAGCGTGNSTPAAKDIVILYTNDAHCGIEDGMGYQGLSAAKRALLAAGNKVLLVDNGDAVQGDTIGTLSKGEYIIDIMNKLGYDVATPGNHEFDYGMDQFNKLVEKADFDYISCNFVDKDGSPVLKPYVIKEADGVKIAFVGISLVVSSIMIGVITYISVLERKKEIGILRAIGASKRNISQVFNAETFIIGLCAGLIGIGLSLLLMIPGNLLIHHLADTTKVSASLPLVPALVLIALSVVLTLIGGLIPSKKAAKSDPVTALRTE